MASRTLLDVDPSILEKNLLLTESNGDELNTLFPKSDEPKSALIKPTPVTNDMSDVQVDLEKPDLNLNKDIEQSDNEKSDLKNIIVESLQNSAQANQSSDAKTQVKMEPVEKANTDANIVSENPDEKDVKIRKISNALITKELIVKVEDIAIKSKLDDKKDVIKTENVKSKPIDNTGNKQPTVKAGVNKSNSKTSKDQSGTNYELDQEISITLEYDDVLLNDTASEETANKDTAQPQNIKTDTVDKDMSDDKKKTGTDHLAEPNEEVEPSDKQITPVGRCLWVSGLSHTTRANDLKRHFVAQGKVIGAKVVCNSRSTSARCYGYIIMSTPEEADLCVKNLHHSKLLNRFISVQKAKPEKTASTETTNVSCVSDKSSPTTSARPKSNDEEKTKPGDPIEKNTTKDPETSPENKNKKKEDKTFEDFAQKNEKDTKTIRKYTKDDQKRRHNQKEKHDNHAKKIEKEIRERKLDKYKRMEEIRERERLDNEQRRLRELQRRQRESAAKLDRQRQLLRIERERLQKEKMELLRLEKEQIEKEREELKRQKQKIEEAANQKKVQILERRTERERKRSARSPLRRPDDVPIKIMKKHESEKYKDTKSRVDRMASAITKYKDSENFKSSNTNSSKYKNPHSSKDTYSRNEYKHSDRRDSEFSRSNDHSKYLRYVDDKKSMEEYKERDGNLKPMSSDYIKSNDYPTKRSDGFSQQMIPPRISSSEANHFNVLPMTHGIYGFLSNNRIREDCHSKEMFAPPPPSVRSVDRVSDRFPQDRDRHNEPIDMNRRARPYTNSGIDCFPKTDTRPSARPERFDKTRLSRDDHRHGEPISPHSSGRYHEREYRHHDQWYPDNGSASVTKRSNLSAMASQRDMWAKAESNSSLWESSRYYDQNMRPPGTYSSAMDRAGKLDRH